MDNWVDNVDITLDEDNLHFQQEESGWLLGNANVWSAATPSSEQLKLSDALNSFVIVVYNPRALDLDSYPLISYSLNSLLYPY